MWGLGQRLPWDGGLQASDPLVSPMVAPFNCSVLLSPTEGSEGTLGPHILHLVPCSTSHSDVCPS